MALALYCPVCGYYEKEDDRIGRRGDFYTSVSVGSLFGELLALQFSEWAKTFGEPPSDGPASASRLERTVTTETEPVHLVEGGAHDGKLAEDILKWLQLRRPALFERVQYWIVEPSARRQSRQRATLQSFGAQMHWVEQLGNLPTVRGVIFANELLDALPVHRLGWDAQQREWFEWGVTLQADRCVWVRLEKTHPASCLAPDAFLESTGSLPGNSSAESEFARTRLSALRELPRELLDVLPDGFTTEICPAAEAWWRQAAETLERGILLTADYGLSAEEFLSPERRHGTVRAYHRHRLAEDVLALPGEQDLTAHVNLTAIQAAGEAAGLRTVRLSTQAAFLTDIARRAWAADSGFGPWTPHHLRQFQTLTHPELLGRAFRVLVQSATDR